MLPWPDLLHGFAAALREPQRPIPPGCIGPDGAADAKRFAIYRNNIASSLIECLAESYPATRRLLGEECFRQIARWYSTQELPRSPVLIEYGEGFPDFLGQLEALAGLPYLADVARIERAWLEAYHAAEASPIAPTVLASVPADRAEQLRLTLHPTVRIVRSRFAALTIWQLNVTAADLPSTPLNAGGEDALICRPEAQVCARAMPEGGAEFVAALAAGEPLARAAERAACACARFDLAEHLTALLEGGLIIDARLQSPPAAQL